MSHKISIKNLSDTRTAEVEQQEGLTHSIAPLARLVIDLDAGGPIKKITTPKKKKTNEEDKKETA